jgi:ABC-type multidrug transport system ATPase subunit
VHIAHRIAVLDKGQLVELGTHEALMAQQGLYHRLYSLQFKDEDEPARVPSEESSEPSNGATPVRRRRGFNPLQALQR